MDKTPEKIKNMFDEISSKYDFVNNLISLGMQKFIKEFCVDKLVLADSASVLDLCTGTGDIAGFIRKKYPESNVLGVDFSSKMIEIARKKFADVEFIEADCTNLPFEDESFDVVTISFGLRNIEDYGQALKEIHRVLKKNGIFMHIDFGKNNCVADFLFDFVVPKLVKSVYKNVIPYQYLIDSKQKFFNSKQLVELFEQYGFAHKKTYNFLFGAISSQVMKK